MNLEQTIKKKKNELDAEQDFDLLYYLDFFHNPLF